MEPSKTTAENPCESLAANITKSLPEPPEIIKTGFAKVFETLLNQLAKLDTEQGEAFSSLNEKTIQITLKDLSQTFFVTYFIKDIENIKEKQGRFAVKSHLVGTPDCHIKTTLQDLVKQADSSELIGNSDLGKTFILGLQQLEIDWEEQLSHITGDLIAFKIGHGIRETGKAQSATQQKVAETFKEYLQFEVNLLPTRSQAHKFSKLVEQTEQEVDALEVRVNSIISNNT